MTSRKPRQLSSTGAISTVGRLGTIKTMIRHDSFHRSIANEHKMKTWYFTWGFSIENEEGAVFQTTCVLRNFKLALESANIKFPTWRLFFMALLRNFKMVLTILAAACQMLIILTCPSMPSDPGKVLSTTQCRGSTPRNPVCIRGSCSQENHTVFRSLRSP